MNKYGKSTITTVADKLNDFAAKSANIQLITTPEYIKVTAASAVFWCADVKQW